ncbi:hypothetical protein K4L44_16040 [Halosquirtibacter laminarini]|uniref:Uncharacterized protein n=1 Tax=Halosquirtibacter laminarini TaxID=3374600 RepID=A0AC61NEL0_9BACT|nr:hypothetical protein K4L44_16040 [Prolixibacteraceae bacterium]
MVRSILFHISRCLFLFAISLVLFLNIAKAQVQVGVTPQVGVTHLEGKSGSQNSNGISAGIDGYIQYDFKRLLSLKAGIGFDFNQYDITYNGPIAPESNETLNSSFITIPIELVMSPTGKWDISIGAEYRMLLNNKDILNSDKLKYAINFGVAKDIGTSAIGLKLSYGLNDLVAKKSKQGYQQSYTARPFTIKLLYRIPLKRRKEDQK